jgi:uncharacterized membrane-anchored protein
MNIHQVLQLAIQAKLLPEQASMPVSDGRPWAVVLLTALGAWLAVIPLLIFVYMLLGPVAMRGLGPFAVGVLMLGAAVVVLRSQHVPLFAEQLAVPSLLAGGGSLAFGVFRSLPPTLACLLMALLALGLALVLRQHWLQAILGALACFFVGLSGQGGWWLSWHIRAEAATWYGLHLYLLLGLWLLAHAVQSRGGFALAAKLESILAGWLVAMLLSLALQSGMTFLVGGNLGGMHGVHLQDIALSGHTGGSAFAQIFSCCLAGVALGLVARAWPSLRVVWFAAVGVLAVVLAWFMPGLGIASVAMAFCATTHRWRAALAAGVTMAWTIGAFYYQLAWPLANKALLFVAVGALLGICAWVAMRIPTQAIAGTHSGSKSYPTAQREARPYAQALIALGAVAILLVVNVGIWQKQQLIHSGQKIFIELAPRDPRSLMQGDYMALNFRLPSDVSTVPLLGADRPRLVLQRDGRGVHTPVRLDKGAPLQDGELYIELTPKNGSWILVSDAWYFREGDAPLWATARFGEFRVTANGRALLVGMADAALQPILAP